MSNQTDPWNYKRVPFKGKMRVYLEPPLSSDTCTTVKYEFSVFAPEVQRALPIILQTPDFSVRDAEEFPEIYKRCGDDRIQMLISAVSDEGRFSVWRFCLEVLSEVSGIPFDTIKKYLYVKSRQIKKTLPGRPVKSNN
jgi:hypothetical protein